MYNTYKQILAAAAASILIAGCASGTTDTADNTVTPEEPVQIQESTEHEPEDRDTALIVYFSRTGENYEVGVITEGNTAKVADRIAEETGYPWLEIVPEVPYPEVYQEMTDLAMKEKNEQARPAYKYDTDDWDTYDTIYLGYPIWWADMPMIVYHFIESHDFTGKTVYPFCTHEGSGLAGTVETIRELCPGADVRDGLAVRGSTAQSDNQVMHDAVRKWLDTHEEGETQ